MRSTRIRLAATAALAAFAAARRRKALFILAAAGLLGIVAGCSSGGDTAKNDSVELSQDVFARAGGWIAFRNGSEIVAVDPANPKHTLVLGPALDDDPIAWSSDGTKLLLRSGVVDLCCLAWGLFVLHPDGSRTTLRPEDKRTRWDSPTWGSFSPDGTEVAYGASGLSRGPFIIDADGGKPRELGRRCPREKISGRLIELCGEPLPEAAAWSPDGSSIAWFDFVEDSATYGHHAYVLSFVNADGTGLREEVAPLPRAGAPLPYGAGGSNSNLVWSPDGSRLAFESDQIFVINADGSGLRQVTGDGDNHWPAWSPDGSRIAFVHDGTLSTIAPDGTDLQRLNGVTPDGAIAWNPAG